MSAGRGVGTTNADLPNDSRAVANAAAHLRVLAREPRGTGSGAAANARRYCADVLSSLGFTVVERPFEYSATVGELGTPAAGIAMLLVLLGAAAEALDGSPHLALAVLVVGLALVMFIGRWAAREGILQLPFLRRQGVNLEARRPGSPAGLWLVAHGDSKSQPVPLVMRASGIVMLGLAWIAAAVFALNGALRSEGMRNWWIGVIVAGFAGAIPVIASVVGTRSAGAVDNASGVATVLGAAELLPGSLIGVLITDAEELGLAGARAWCACNAAERVPVLNCDGVDDQGKLTLMWTRPRATRLEQVVQDAAHSELQELRVIPLIPGVLVDGLAFSDAGWPVVTLSRGSLETLRRIHTPNDNLQRLRGTGVATTARVLAGAARLILEQA